MSNKQKLIEKFLIAPDFLDYSELPTLDNYLNWEDYQQRRIFINDEIDDSQASIITDIIRWNEEDRLIKFSSDPMSTIEPIKIYIHTNGGDIDVTFGIISAIKSSQTPVYTYALGKAYSAGALILIAGHVRYAYEFSNILIHEGQVGVMGSSSKTEDFINFHKRQKEKIKDFILANTKINEEQYKQKARDEWYMFGNEALELGIVDNLIG